MQRSENIWDSSSGLHLGLGLFRCNLSSLLEVGTIAPASDEVSAFSFEHIFILGTSQTSIKFGYSCLSSQMSLLILHPASQSVHINVTYLTFTAVTHSRRLVSMPYWLFFWYFESPLLYPKYHIHCLLNMIFMIYVISGKNDHSYSSFPVPLPL